MKHNALKYAAQKLNSSESERLRSLKEYDISDNFIDESFDILTEMAKKVTQCSVAAISFIHSDKLFFKSLIGLKGEYLERGNLPCEITITKSDIYEVEDLSKHPTLKQNLLAKDGKTLRYYAGVPLINKEGYPLGTICVFDVMPQKLGSEKLQMLNLLGRKAMTTIELHRKERLAREALEARSEKLIKGQMDLVRQEKRLERAKAGITSKDQLLQGILDNSPHLISLVDNRGHYVMVNNAVAELLELPVEAIIGRHISEMHKDTERIGKNLEMMQQVLKTRLTSPPYDEVLTIKGATNYYQVVMIPVEDGRGDLMVLRIATNVTDLKTLEVDLNRKNSELESLIYSLSHDLRGPISSILGLLNVEKYASLSDMRQYFKMIKEQTLRMDTSIHDLVELKNVTNKAVKPETLDVVELVKKVAARFTEAKTMIHLIHPEELHFSSDEYFIHTALNRVLANAVNFHSKDSKSPKVEVLVESQSGGVLLKIKDNGLGITKKALPRVFEMFYRGTGASTGHGLGLYIAQNALNRVKGVIGLNSIEGMGTEVEIFIPRIDGKAYYE